MNICVYIYIHIHVYIYIYIYISRPSIQVVAEEANSDDSEYVVELAPSANRLIVRDLVGLNCVRFVTNREKTIGGGKDRVWAGRGQIFYFKKTTQKVQK